MADRPMPNNFWAGFTSTMMQGAMQGLQTYGRQQEQKAQNDYQTLRSMLISGSGEMQLAASIALGGLSDGKVKPGKGMGIAQNILDSISDPAKRAKLPGWALEKFNANSSVIQQIQSEIGLEQFTKVFGAQPLPMPEKGATGQGIMGSFPGGNLDTIGGRTTGPPTAAGASSGGQPPLLMAPEGVTTAPASGAMSAAQPIVPGPGVAIDQSKLQPPSATPQAAPQAQPAQQTAQPPAQGGPPPGPFGEVQQALTSGQLSAFDVSQASLEDSFARVSSKLDQLEAEMQQWDPSNAQWYQKKEYTARFNQARQHYKELFAMAQSLRQEGRGLAERRGKAIDAGTSKAIAVLDQQQGRGMQREGLDIQKANLGLRRAEMGERRQARVSAAQKAQEDAIRKQLEKVDKDIQTAWRSHQQSYEKLLKPESSKFLHQAEQAAAGGVADVSKLTPDERRQANTNYATYIEDAYYKAYGSGRGPSATAGYQIWDRVWQSLGTGPQELEQGDPQQLVTVLRNYIKGAMNDPQDPLDPQVALFAWQSGVAALARRNSSGYLGSLGRLDTLP